MFRNEMGPARGIRSELLLGATGSEADVEKLMNSLKGVEAFDAKFEVVSPTRLHTILSGGDRLRSSVRPRPKDLADSRLLLLVFPFCLY